MPRKPPIQKKMLDKGWRVGVFDTCWLACENPGHVHDLLVVNEKKMTIVLCVPHIRELEETSYGGYAFANPPENHPEGTWWPWIDYDEAAMQWGLDKETDDGLVGSEV